jgi:hypothetical protein
MRKKEHAALLKMLRMAQQPVVSREHIDRLNSSDFQLGWRLCHEGLKSSIEFLLRATPSELHQYLRSPER